MAVAPAGVWRGKADLVFEEDPAADPAAFLARHGDDLRRLGVAAVYTVLERAKFAERSTAHALGLPAVSPDVLACSRDKRRLREALASTSLDSAPFFFLPDDAPIPPPPLQLPFIVKPNLGYCSGGVRLARVEAEWRLAVGAIRRLNQSIPLTGYAGPAGTIAEPYIDGPEFAVDSLTVAGRTRTFAVCAREFPAPEDFQDFVYLYEPDQTRPYREAVLRCVAESLAAIGHTDGPSHVELRVDRATGGCRMLEAALRVGFGGNVGRIVRETTGGNYNLWALRAASRRLPPAEFESLPDALEARGVLFAPSTGPGGILAEIGGAEWLGRDARVRHHRFLVDAGDRVIPYPESLSSLGVVLGVAEDREDLRRLVERLRREVVVRYVTGA